MNLSDSDRTPLVRTDFSDDEAWRRIVEAVLEQSEDGFLANLNIVDDSQYEKVSPDKLIKGTPTLVIVADGRTVTEPEMPLLCIYSGPQGGQLRCIPSKLWSVENNLSLANMDFSDFVPAIDADGIFRGFHS